MYVHMLAYVRQHAAEVDYTRAFSAFVMACTPLSMQFYNGTGYKNFRHVSNLFVCEQQ